MSDRAICSRLFFSLVFGICLWAVVCCAPVAAGGGPENVLVVVNDGSQSSKLIANHYIALRKIPARNVVYLGGIPDRDSMDLEQFMDLVLRPILVQIEDRGLAGSVDYIVYSADFPTRVRIRKILQQLIRKAEADGQKLSSENRRRFNPEASINSLTFFANWCLLSDSGNGGGLMAPNANRYFRLPSNGVLQKPFTDVLQNQFQRQINAYSKPIDDPQYQEAIVALEKMARSNPGQMALYYWLAKFEARNERPTDAAKWLTQAMRMGLSDRESIEQDPDFKSLEDPLFRGLVRRMSNQGSRYATTRSFRQLYQWAPNGMLNRTPGQGERYFLSTVLAVTRNDGTTEKEAVEQIKQTVAADFSKPTGTFYFTESADVRTKTRKSFFDDTIAALEELGFSGKVIQAVMPENAKDIIGLTTGTPRFQLEGRNNRIVPGAICENLTSYGGRVGTVSSSKTGQTKLSRFLKFGAAGSSGTVVEPLALWQKFPHPFIHVHYARGCSLAEAFYQSIHSPFQTLIVGDALCQPFATEPKVEVSGIVPGQLVGSKTTLNFDVSGSPIRVAGMELYMDGDLFKRDPSLKPIEMDPALLSDGYHELRVVFVAANRAETTTRTIIPFFVDNKSQVCKLSIDKQQLELQDRVTVSVSAPNASSIRIVHNWKTIARLESGSGEVRIAASEFGRGPVSVQAIATFGGIEVASERLEFEVRGELSTERARTGKSR